MRPPPRFKILAPNHNRQADLWPPCEKIVYKSFKFLSSLLCIAQLVIDVSQVMKNLGLARLLPQVRFLPTPNGRLETRQVQSQRHNQ